MRRFTLLTRPDCHLCEVFEAEVVAVFGERLEIEAVQVDHHPAWQAEYGLRIPVLLDPQERFVCAVTVDANAIRAALS
ncbi:MAG: glutaredoxin family protein [Stagnimonas sp.]|nr:glutaredoxin family protein [Stagnimonas sp.]